MNRKNITYLVTGLSSVIALLLHVYLVWEFFQVKYAMGGGSGSLCSFSDKFDCAAVAASPYSAFLGIPLAQFGLWSNLIFTALLISHWIGSRFSDQPSPLVRFGLTGIISVLGLGTLTMGSVALFVMKVYCLFCLATYALSIITIFGTWTLLKSDKPNSLFQNFKPIWLLSIILIPIGSWLAHSIIMKQLGGSKLPLIIQESVLEWKSNPQHTFDTNLGVVYGNKTGSTSDTIVEFVDLFCPHCKYASYPLKAFTKARNSVRLVVKLFPLDGTCNKAIGSGDGFRCKWSSVVVCATANNQGPEVLSWIFDQQAELSQSSFDSGLSQLVSALNLSEDILKPCLDSEATQQTLKAMIEEGEKAKLKGTPTIFVNGKQLPRGQLMPVLDAALSK